MDEIFTKSLKVLVSKRKWQVSLGIFVVLSCLDKAGRSSFSLLFKLNTTKVDSCCIAAQTTKWVRKSHLNSGSEIAKCQPFERK